MIMQLYRIKLVNAIIIAAEYEKDSRMFTKTFLFKEIVKYLRKRLKIFCAECEQNMNKFVRNG